MNEDLSSIEFLMSTATRANGFTPKFIEAVADVTWKAERAQKLEEEIDSEIDNERELNKIIGSLRSENAQLRHSLQSACNSLGADIEDYL